MSFPKVSKIVKKVLSFLLDTIFPLDTFSKELKEMSLEIFLSKITLSQSLFDNFINSYLNYQEKITEQTLWQLKFNRNGDAARLLGELLYKNIFEKIKDQEHIIIPVPIYRRKEKSKGFNHTELLVQEIVRHDKGGTLIYKKDLIVKIKKTKDQKETKNRKERMENIKDAFMVTKPAEIENQNIILIDDIHTTGATLNEIKIILEKAKAKKVIAFVVAH